MIYNSIFPESGLTLELATRKRSELTANGASLFAATGKAFALLWQIFLQVGPSYKKLRLWLSRVTCILTDCGAERKIPDMRDILPEFLDAIGVKYPMGCRMEYLFFRMRCQPLAGITYSMAYCNGASTLWISFHYS